MELADTVRAVVRRGREKELTFMAASVAFYAFFSVIPVVILVLAVASSVGGDAFEERVVTSVGTYLSPEGEVVVAEALESPVGRLGASAVGVVALIWSALKVFRAVDIAFDRVYGDDRATSFARSLLNASVVLTAIVVGVGTMVGVRLAVALLGDAVPFLGAAGWLVLLTGLVSALLPFYYVMPPERVSVRHALPGTAVAVIGWLALRAVFGFYATVAARYQAYGLLGAVLLFLLWLYFGALVLLVGAVVNSVVADG